MTLTLDQVGPLTDWASDDGQGRWLGRVAPEIRYVIGLEWIRWDGKRWEPVDVHRVRSVVKAIYLAEYDAALESFRRTDDKKWLRLAKQLKEFMGSRHQSNILNAISGLAPLDLADMDSNPHLLNTPRGVVDLRTGAVTPSDPALFMTKITRGSYLPGYTHPDWSSALRALPAETSAYLQLRFGQALTGNIPVSDDVCILQGDGGNGKSVEITGMMQAVGDYGMLADPGLVLSIRMGGPSPERASLRGVHVAVIEELPEDSRLNMPEIKRITGNETITARKLHTDQMTFRASHTLFITSNPKPVVVETDDGSWRRLCLINYPYEFCDDPTGDYQLQGDPGLRQRVFAGAEGQHDAILTWAVEGAKRYYSDPRLIMPGNRPAQVVQDTFDWRGGADRILGYALARIVPDPERMVSTRDLYLDFCDWLEQNGHQRWAQETFHAKFSRHKEIRKHNVYAGRVRDHHGIDRPYRPMGTSPLPPLPTRPPVYVGLRFEPGN